MLPLRILAAVACAALFSPSAHAQAGLPLPVDLDPKVETLLAPLSAVPAIQRADEPLNVELAAGAAGDPRQVAAVLTPSFGSVRTPVELGAPFEVSERGASALWPARAVDHLKYRLPGDLAPGLYDLEVGAPGTGVLSQWSGSDHQRRAVSIVTDYPETPRVIVIADPSIGDPRPLQDAALDAVQRNEINDAVLLAQRSIGNPLNSERWAAFARVIAEVNLVRPDFVLVTGDLTFLTFPSAAPYEYEDAWQLLDRLEVPAYLTPGNHDLYAVDDYLGDTPPLWDGKDLWPKFFGPLHYALDAGPRLHLVSLNTFEWSKLDPFPVEDEFDTRAAGHMTADQVAWLEADLRAYRERAPDGVIVTFAHHDPSWMQRRHAWTGEGRLETRDLLARYHAGAHFSGHTHEDRVARHYLGDVVETNGRPHIAEHVVRQLHLLKRDGALDLSLDQARLGEILREPSHGPLFVSTTTAASQLIGDIWGLGGYWGWRLARLDNRDGRGGLDPADFGYPATDAFLAERAERPEHWTEAHAQYGVFSYPSYELDVEALSDTELRITSRLLADLEVNPRFSLPMAQPRAFRAEGGEVTHARYGEGQADVWVRATVPAKGQVTLRLLPATDSGKVEPARFGGAFGVSLLAVLLLAAGGRRRSWRW